MQGKGPCLAGRRGGGGGAVTQQVATNLGKRGRRMLKILRYSRQGVARVRTMEL